MAFENALHIDELDASSPLSTDDPFGTNAIYLELQQLKTVLTTDFANVSGAVTASDVQMNYLDITTLGTAEVSKVLTLDGSGNANAAAVTWTNLGVVTTVDINGGTVDATSIGATTPAAGAFTTLSASTSLVLASGATVTAILDEDAMGSDSATALATQQSVKAYVDTTYAAASTYTDARARIALNYVFVDVSTAETIYVPIPVAGDVIRMDTILEGTISTNDATITLTTSADAAMCSLVVTASGSAAGDHDSTTAFTNETVAAGDVLKLKTDGNSSLSQRLWITVLVDIS